MAVRWALMVAWMAAAGCGGSEPVEWYALDLGDRTVGVEERRFVRADDGVDVTRRWRVGAGGGESTVHLAPGEELRVDLAPLVARRVAAEPDLPDDLNALLSVPSEALPLARSSRSASFEVTGAIVPDRPLQSVEGSTVVVTVPMALEVPRELRERLDAWIALADEGDCQARSAALLEIAKAEGYDARGVVGLVYLDVGRPPGFYAHAWVEVQSPSGPIPVDPTLRQPVADAARLVLAEDGPDAPGAVLRALAAISVETVALR